MRISSPSLLALVAAASFACAPVDPFEVESSPLQMASEPGTIRILSPTDGAVVSSPLTLRFEFEVVDQAPIAVPLTIRSTLRDPIWTGNIARTGEVAWTGEAPEGSQVLSIEGVDRLGNPFGDSVRVLVQEPPQPDCAILSPQDGAIVQAGTDVRFEALAQEADGTLIDVFWRSSLEGALALGREFDRRMLVQGVHTITIEGPEPFQRTCADQILLLVE